MKKIDFQEKYLEMALFQFIFPFSFRNGTEQNITPLLQKNNYRAFRLDHLEDQNDYYGKFQVSHRDLEANFLSFTSRILFPHNDYQKGLHRYSKAINITGCLQNKVVSVPFKINSIDITLCPFELGFLTIRTEISEKPTLSSALEFADTFRTIEVRSEKNKTASILFNGISFSSIETFIFDYLFNGLTDFFDKKIKKEAYFETFPFFEDERMYVQSLLIVNKNQAIDVIDVYRAGNLCGLSLYGKPYVDADNFPYIEEYLKIHGYHRWAPNTYFVIEEHILTCMSTDDSELVSHLASQFYGKYYYGLILNLFHKFVLLKLAHSHAVIDTDRDYEDMERLIYSINSFTANFFSLELVTPSQNQEIFYQLRKIFNIELLFKNAKETLYSLFKYQENMNGKKESLLLLILTLYSVIGQMFGMSLVTGDFIGRIKWKHIFTYNPIEYLALFVAASGILTSIFLGVKYLRDWKLDRKNRTRWIKQTVLSSIEKEK